MAKYWLPSIKLGGIIYNLPVLNTTSVAGNNWYDYTVLGDEMFKGSVGLNNTQVLTNPAGNVTYWWTALYDGRFTGNIEIYYNLTLIGSVGGGLFWDNTTNKTLAILMDDATKTAYIYRSQYNNEKVLLLDSIVTSPNLQLAYLWAKASIPIVYNYKPVDYIYGNSTSLKLSMIKEASTNGGASVEFTSPTPIQRFTEKSNLHFILQSMSLNGTKILGYTDNNNYVMLSKTLEGEGFERGVIKYYIDGTHQSNLDFEINMLYGNPDTEFHYYLSYLVDTEKKACRQSIITIRLNNSSGNYNSEENDRNIVTENYQTLMYEWLSTGYFTESSDDPNEQGGTSNPGGGNGGYNNIGDDIPVPQKPSVSTVDADFITVYNPTLAQIKSLARYMWSGDFNLESFKKIFTDPMDCIIGLHMIPCSVPINGAQKVKVGNLLSPVIMNLAANQFVDVDCGSIKIDEYWGSYLDYSPYTKIIIYLPYIGTQPLEVDDVMNKTVNVKYRIDIVTGSCVCFIIVNGVVLYQFSGSCIATIPITSQDYKNVLTNIVSIGIAGAGVASSIIATGGVSTPVAAGAAYVAANGVMSNKPTIAHGNSASGTAGFMSIQTPYITITRAKQCLPKSQNTFTGYPSYTTKKLSTLTGFTQVEEIQLNSLSCTDGERKEIESLLKGGVII